MKNIHTLLSEIGFTVPEDKKVDFEKAFADNYKTVSEVEKLRTSRDNYKSQLETAQTALKKFEGVNVDELKGEIKKLIGELETKETEYQTRIADMEFNSVLDGAISESGARNTKAVKALLDLENLKTSKRLSNRLSPKTAICSVLMSLFRILSVQPIQVTAVQAQIRLRQCVRLWDFLPKRNNFIKSMR